MGWADDYIETLKAGISVSFRPVGNSMTPIIESGQLCRVKPYDFVNFTHPIKKGDIVLCMVGKKQYLHIIRGIHKDRYQIGNNHGKMNGWILKSNIFGKLVSVK